MLAGSLGVLNTRRDHTINRQKNVPLPTGSITRRTPVKISQSLNQKQQGNCYSQEPHLTSIRTEQIFQFDTKPLIE